MNVSPPTRRTAMKLNELGSVGRGRSRHRPRNDPSLYGGAYPFFQTGDVKAADLFLTEFSQTYNDKGLAQSKHWEPGTVCITIAANIAETALLGIAGCFPDSVVGFVPDPDKADARFIKYYIDTIKQGMQNVSKGTTQDNLSLDKLLTFDFLVPDVEAQRRTADTLSAYDCLIANNTRRIAILEEMAQAIYREWFVDFRFNGRDEGDLGPTDAAPIPAGWNVRRVGDVFEVVLGGTPARVKDEYWKDGTVPWINSGKVNELRIIDESEFITQAGLRHSAAKLMPPRTTAVAITGATLGQVSLLEIEAAANQSVVGITDRDGLRAELLYLFFTNAIDEVIQHASGGAQQHINKGIIEDVRFLDPAEAVVRRFKSIVEPMFDEVANLLRCNRLLRQTRDLLLPKLISGEIEVPAVEVELEAVAA